MPVYCTIAEPCKTCPAAAAQHVTKKKLTGGMPPASSANLGPTGTCTHSFWLSHHSITAAVSYTFRRAYTNMQRQAQAVSCNEPIAFLVQGAYLVLGGFAGADHSHECCVKDKMSSSPHANKTVIPIPTVTKLILDYSRHD